MSRRAKPSKHSRRPTKAELAAAHDRTVPDVIAFDLDVLIVGINPSLYSAAVGHHFARPGNRFWPALHGAGFTERVWDPSESMRLIEVGCGITNVVARATARADELSRDEFTAGAEDLARKVRRFRPKSVAFLGVTAFRDAFGRRGASVGPQAESWEGAAVWVLPNPSGLNAHYQLPDLVKLYAELRQAVRTDAAD